jgi:uncharacterized protein
MRKVQKKMKYFFDTYAIIGIFEDLVGYKKYKEEEIFTSVLNLGELFYYFLRIEKEDIGKEWFNILSRTAKNVNSELILEAMKMKYKYKKRKMSMADCVGYITAKNMDLKFLTGDKEFEDLPNVEFIK